MPLEEMQLILFNRSVDSSTDIDTTLAQLRASNEIMAMAAPFAVVARTQNGFFAFDANNELRFFSERHNAESVPVDIFRSRYLDSEQVSQIMRKYEELVATARYNNAAMTLEYVAFLRQARENNPDLSMRDALAMFELNSVAIVDKYRGGNCFAMANHFVSTIRERLGIDAYVIGNDVYNEALTLNRSDWREAFDYIERAHGSVVIPYVNRDTLIPTYLHLEMGLPYEQARSHNYDEFSPNGYVKPEESLTNVDESIMTNQIRIRNKLVITDVSQKEVLVVNMLRGRLEINGKQTAMFMDKFTLPEMTYGRHGITIDLNSLLANLNQTRDIVFDGETVTLTNAEVINLVLEELGEHFDLPSDFAENMQYLLHRRDEYYSDLMLDSAGQVYRNQ
jgi:hypothetical protein